LSNPLNEPKSKQKEHKNLQKEQIKNQNGTKCSQNNEDQKVEIKKYKKCPKIKI